MNKPFSLRSKSSPECFALFACVAAIAAGILVLGGWALDADALKRVLPGRVAMNPATAVCFILSGIVCLLLLILWTAKTLNRIDARRRRAEASLAESEGRFRLLVESVHDYAIYMLDPAGRVTTWNSAARRIKGYAAEEILGQHFSRFYPPETVSSGACDEELRLAAEQGRFEEEGWRQRQDGTRFWANVIITPVRNADGELTGFAKITRDITERREADERIRSLAQSLERRVAERTAQLAESNRQLTQQNEENEMFVYSVSHDLRSPLVNLQGFSKELETACQEARELLASSDVPPHIQQRALACVDEGMAEPIRFIQTAVTRLGAIIDALLRLSRAGRVEYHSSAVDLNEVLGRVVDSMKGTIVARQARVTVRELAAVWADATAVEQIFANLVGNALNYLDPARPGEIEVALAESGDLPERGSRSGLLTFSVRDNGVGIAAAQQGKIFQGFQRLRPQMARGEGMGLTIVRRLVERHGGKVWLESTAGVGSAFFLTLPAAPRQPIEGDNNRGTSEKEALYVT